MNALGLKLDCVYPLVTSEVYPEMRGLLRALKWVRKSTGLGVKRFQPKYNDTYLWSLGQNT